MTAVLVDANVLLDVMTEDASRLAWSADVLEQTADRHRLVIDPVIDAEVPVRSSRIGDLDAALRRAMFEREAVPNAAALLAGKAFLGYRRRAGTRRAPLPDVFIGAHAAVALYWLMTRDAARYRTYFPRLRLIAPDGA